MGNSDLFGNIFYGMFNYHIIIIEIRYEKHLNTREGDFNFIIVLDLYAFCDNIVDSNRDCKEHHALIVRLSTLITSYVDVLAYHFIVIRIVVGNLISV